MLTRYKVLHLALPHVLYTRCGVHSRQVIVVVFINANLMLMLIFIHCKAFQIKE